jgi:hypothetical protein
MFSFVIFACVDCVAGVSELLYRPPRISALVYSRKCGAIKGVIRKYGLMICRRCFREKAEEIGFQKVC